MKFKTTKNNLSTILNCFDKLTLKTLNNAFENVLIDKLNDETLTFIAGDGSTFIKYNLKVDELEFNEFKLYNIKRLNAIINKLDGDITFKNDTIFCKKSKFKISNSEVDFPKDLKFISEEPKNILNCLEFKNALSKTNYATAKIDGVLSGLYLNKNEIVATDGNRLCKNKIQTTDLQIIISRHITPYLKLFNSKEIEIQIDKNNIIFSNENCILRTNKINGNYPKYEQLLPKNFINEVILNKKELIEAINTITFNLEEKLIFKFNSDNCIVSNKENEASIEFDLIETDFKDDFEICLNAKYLLEALNNFSEEKTFISFTGTLSPIVISTNKEEYCLIMPIKL